MTGVRLVFPLPRIFLQRYFLGRTKSFLIFGPCDQFVLLILVLSFAIRVNQSTNSSFVPHVGGPMSDNTGDSRLAVWQFL